MHFWWVLQVGCECCLRQRSLGMSWVPWATSYGTTIPTLAILYSWGMQLQCEQFPIPAGAEIHALHLCLLCLSVCKPPIYSPALAVPNLPAAPPTHLAHSPFGECKSVYCVQILYSLNLCNHFCYLLLLCASTPLPCTPEQQYAALHTLLQYCSGSCHGCVGALIFILSYLEAHDPERILPYIDRGTFIFWLVRRLQKGMET